ncbi:hypothetical protein H1R20_g6111, partial [Candolleomyces eurysporus]
MGRKARILKVIEVEKRGTSWREKEGTELIVLKVVWIDANTRTERQIQDQLFTEIQSFCGKPDRKSDDRFYLFADPETAGIIQALLQDSRFARKKRCFHLFTDEHTPVDYLPTVGDAFSVLGQCVIALRLMFCAGWIHRDVTAGNVMAVQDAKGDWKLQLADLEHAKAFKDGSPPTIDPKMGTPYFMAYELLSRNYIRVGTQDIDEGTLEETVQEMQGLHFDDPASEEPPLRHNFQHDLESVFWIALWIITARIDHTPSIQHANLIFTSDANLSSLGERQSTFVGSSSKTLSECLVEPLRPLARFLEYVRNDLYRAAFHRGEILAWEDEKSYSLIHAKMTIRFVFFLKATRGWEDIPLAPRDSETPSPAFESAAEAANVLVASRGSMGSPTRRRVKPTQPTSTSWNTPTWKKGTKIDMKYIYKFPNKANGSRFFSTTVTSISGYRTMAVTGRKARVFKFIEVEKRGTSWREKEGSEPIVLKVVSFDTNPRTEKQIQEQLFTEIQSFCGKAHQKKDDRLDFYAEPEAARIIQAFKAELQDKVLGDTHPADPPVFVTEFMTATGYGIQIPSPQTFQVTNLSQDKTNKPEYRRFAPKKRCFHLFTDEHTPVDYLPTVGDAFTVLGQCVIALRLMFCAGWVHQDISAGNVLAFQDADGGWKLKLADFEYAKPFKEGSPPTTDPKTGTPYFMAHEILSRVYIRVGTVSIEEDGLKAKKEKKARRQHVVSPPSEKYPLRHTFQHDLESVFWIALWIITARIDHAPSIRHANLIFISTENLVPSGERQSAFVMDIRDTLSECLVEPLRPLAQALEDFRNDLYAAAYQRGHNLAWQDQKSCSLIHAKMAMDFDFLLEDTRGWGDVPLALPDSKALPPAPESAAGTANRLSASRGSMGPPTLCGAKSPARETSNKRPWSGEDQDQLEGSPNCSRKRGRSADRERASGPVASTSV